MSTFFLCMENSLSEIEFQRVGKIPIIQGLSDEKQIKFPVNEVAVDLWSNTIAME